MIIAVDGPTFRGLGEANVRFPPIADASGLAADFDPLRTLSQAASTRRDFVERASRGRGGQVAQTAAAQHELVTDLRAP